MRSIILTAVVGILLLATLRYPYVGAYLWAWLSLMNPHKLTYGFAFNMPFAYAAALATLVGALYARERRPLPMNGVLVTQIALLAWMSITSLFAVADSAMVFERWIFVVKIHLMLLVTWMLVTDAGKLRGLIWVVVLSVAFFGIKGGVFTILTGGGHRVWGPPGGMIEENNALAVALVMVMPLMYFLRETEPRRWVRYALVVAMVLCTFSILGSQSRGALLAVAAMGLFLSVKSKRAIRTMLFVGVFAALAIAFMPESWTNRMESVRTYEEDMSAMSRIWSWITHWRAAVDRPLVGVGFHADNEEVFARYAPLDGPFAVFRGRVWVAHSVYFQMLGEHGFVGLGIFLLLLVFTWRTAARVATLAAGDRELAQWAPALMRMVQVSLVGFVVGGVFLSLANHDLPYYIMGFVIAADGIVRRALAGAAQPSSVASAPPGRLSSGGAGSR